MNRKSQPFARVFPTALACVLAIGAAWGGCGTIVRNPGDDVDEPPRDSRNGGNTPTPRADQKDSRSPPSAGVVPACAAAIVKSSGMPGSVVASFVVRRGEPPVVVAGEYVFTSTDEGGTDLGAGPVTLTAAKSLSYVVTKVGVWQCASKLEVSEADIAAGGVWEIGVLVK